MYIAELQGKFSPYQERMEDILTSNVFSFFMYARREIFLSEFLRLFDIETESNDLHNAEFLFWPSYEDGTEPDLVIIVGDYYILIEAKFGSGFGKETDFSAAQLIREYNMGKLDAQNLEKTFRLVAVTAHYSKHQFIAENPEVASIEISWINWHQIAILLDKILNTQKDLSIETKTFALDLYRLLLKKNLRKYAGQEILRIVPLLQSSFESLFFDAKSAQYRGDFIGFEHSLEEFQPLQAFQYESFYHKERIFFANLSDDELMEIPTDIFFRR